MNSATTSIPISESPSRIFSYRSLHLATLFAFAFTQPILSALVRQTVFLHDQEFGWLEIGALLGALLLILPLICLLVDRGVSRLSGRFSHYFQNIVFYFLSFFLFLSVCKLYFSSPWFLAKGNGFFLETLTAIIGSGIFVMLYIKIPLVKQWMTIASVGIVVFPMAFLWDLHTIRQSEAAIEARNSPTNPVPVVFIIFDEFSGTTLLNKDLEIDATRFPQFARLASKSAWYRNATTNHPRTDISVPTILSGRFPSIEHSPLAANYPDNLLQLIDSTKTYEMAVFEPITRLGPKSIRINSVPKPHRTSIENAFDLLLTLASVYPHLILTHDAPIELPAIPKHWFGIASNPGQDWGHLEDHTSGLFNYPGSEHRRQQLSHFLSCLKSSDRPQFCFLHAVLPHYPWTLFPSGNEYQSEFAAPRFAMGTHGGLGEDWDDDLSIVLRNDIRYRLQIGFVDRFIGDVIDRLESTELFERCLFVVTADHGVSFRPGHSRRLPDTDNLSEILSVPLFIKLPGQTTGRIDDRNVESVDILPTILEVLGLRQNQSIDGIPVTSEVRRKCKTLFFGGKMTIVEPDLPRRKSSVIRQLELFGSDSLYDLPNAAAAHPEWHGQPLSRFPIDEKETPFKRENNALPNDRGILPDNLISGTLAVENAPTTPCEVVLVIGGTVIDTARTCRVDRYWLGFQFLIPEFKARGNSEGIELFVVDKTAPHVKLRRLVNSIDEE